MRLDGFEGVVITQSSFEGVSPYGKSGLVAEDASIHAWNSAFEGGLDGQASGYADGGDGARLEDSFLYATDCRFEGGDGTDGWFLGTCFGPGDGGHGLALVQTAGTATAVLASSQYVGGSAGDPEPQCAAGAPGEGLFMSGGAIASFLTISAALTRSFEIGPPVIRSGATGTVTIEGRPGELAFVALANSAAAIYLPSLQGSVVLADPLTVLGVGVLDGAGALSLPFDVNLPAGVEGAVVRAQSVTFGATDGLLVGAPSAAVLVAASL